MGRPTTLARATAATTASGAHQCPTPPTFSQAQCALLVHTAQEARQRQHPVLLPHTLLALASAICLSASSAPQVHTAQQLAAQPQQACVLQAHTALQGPPMLLLFRVQWDTRAPQAALRLLLVLLARSKMPPARVHAFRVCQGTTARSQQWRTRQSTLATQDTTALQVPRQPRSMLAPQAHSTLQQRHPPSLPAKLVRLARTVRRLD